MSWNSYPQNNKQLTIVWRHSNVAMIASLPEESKDGRKRSENNNDHKL